MYRFRRSERFRFQKMDGQTTMPFLVFYSRLLHATVLYLQVPLLFSPLWSLTPLVFSPLFDAWQAIHIRTWWLVFVLSEIATMCDRGLILNMFRCIAWLIQSANVLSFILTTVHVLLEKFCCCSMFIFNKAELLSLSNLLLTYSYFQRSLRFCLLHVVQ